jgi:fumarylacetoacetase
MRDNTNLRSFIPVDENSHFPIQNLPYGVFIRKKQNEPRIGTALGDYVLDLAVLEEKGFFSRTSIGKHYIFSRASLNKFMSLGSGVWSEVRSVIQNVLSEDSYVLRDDENLKKECLFPMNEVKMCMPVKIGDYTDFYSSKEHATNVGTMFRGKENALMPNWLYVPIAYHGRTSSIVNSGKEVFRPYGQIKPDSNPSPIYGLSEEVDFELEMGLFIGPGNKQGKAISVERAYENIFGMVLVNDWSARDIQRWEYVPLGPFLAKNFATSISPWVVTMEALEPFRTAGPIQDPEPLPYLANKGKNAFDIQLEVYLQTENLPERVKISGTNFKYMYWNIYQQVAHHTVNGCNLRTGDLLASGTISGPEPDSYGSMLELTWRGEKPIKLPSGEERTFLKDGDSIIMTGYCQGEGYRVGFGEVSGKIVPHKEQTAKTGYRGMYRTKNG